MATLGEYLGAGSGTTKLLLHLNGNSTDSSGNSNNGTDTAITYSQANGKFGQGAGFNGSTSSINIPYTGFTSGANPFTNNSWVLINSLPPTNGYSFIDFWGAASANNSVGNGLHNNSGTQNIIFANYGNDLEIATTLSTRIWYMITSTYDGTTLKGYLNGVLIGSGARSINITSNSTYHHIGSQFNGGFLNGAIDEVIIENRSWSATEVAKYYSYSKGRFGII